ncbi:flagellar hook-length control protein FliK [Occultella aeris]|uniref:Flagellar hook-length control protein FliK n=1 Tax=Occultella aeris TaxID=2761496 RepID=A0A7M4DDG7_9MICO|nr:flagellar hook-length control protein FliK [Occultella aeris]VZO34886.1 Flagellar hook-length control protein FliK [Occultella aeris]
MSAPTFPSTTRTLGPSTGPGPAHLRTDRSGPAFQEVLSAHTGASHEPRNARPTDRSAAGTGGAESRDTPAARPGSRPNPTRSGPSEAAADRPGDRPEPTGPGAGAGTDPVTALGTTPGVPTSAAVPGGAAAIVDGVAAGVGFGGPTDPDGTALAPNAGGGPAGSDGYVMSAGLAGAPSAEDPAAGMPAAPSPAGAPGTPGALGAVGTTGAAGAASSQRAASLHGVVTAPDALTAAGAAGPLAGATEPGIAGADAASPNPTTGQPAAVPGTPSDPATAGPGRWVPAGSDGVTGGAPSVATAPSGSAPTAGPDASPSPTLTAPLTAPAPNVPVTATAPAAVGPSASPWPAAATLLDGLLTLRSTPAGQHTLTINVTPDHLGPIAVRALITADGVRIELQTPDAGREALRAILPDLRRDLAAGGLNATLDLDSGPRDQPGSATRAGSDGDDAHHRGPGAGHSEASAIGRTEGADHAPWVPDAGRPADRPGGATALDVLL